MKISGLFASLVAWLTLLPEQALAQTQAADSSQLRLATQAATQRYYAATGAESRLLSGTDYSTARNLTCRAARFSRARGENGEPALRWLFL